jgi:hypothetical protein
MLELGGDFDEGGQDEFALQHAWMGDLQLWHLQRLIAEEKDVDVEQAGAFGEGLLAAELRFDGSERSEQIERVLVGFASDDTVEEPGLIEIVDGFGFVKGRNLAGVKSHGREPGNGCKQIGDAIS